MIVDSAANGGGSGGGGGGTGGSVPFVCDGMGSELRYLCLPGSSGASCPALETVRETLAEQVYGSDECAGSGTCCNTTEAGCGPDPGAVGQCCYQVGFEFYSCEGRPFTVDGAARTALLEARSDWLADLPIQPSLAGLDDATRSALADKYARSALFEHASVASFARFALELCSVGAPADLLVATQRAIGDEVRHARLCFSLASAYAGAPMGPSTLAMGHEAGRARSAEEIAAAVVIEGCINETISAILVAAERDRAGDPAVRQALSSIAEDEAAHAELAFRYVAWAHEHGGESVRRAIRDAFAGAALRDPEIDPALAADPEALAAHGCLPAAARRALSRAALGEVVQPAARALLMRGHERRAVG